MNSAIKKLIGTFAVALGLSSVATWAAEKEIRNGESTKSEKPSKGGTDKEGPKKREPICGA